MEKRKTRKRPTIGYSGNESRSNGGYRHYWVEFYALEHIDLGECLKNAAISGDEKRIVRFAKAAHLANGREVYSAEVSTSVTWQTDSSFDRWYAGSMSLIGHASEALQRRILAKSIELRGNPVPAALIEALGAVKIRALRDDTGELVRAGGYAAYVVDDSPIDPVMVDPQYKPESVGAA